MARMVITGIAEIEKSLQYMEHKAADKIAKAALMAGMGVLKKAQKNAAPVGQTGNLKAAINSRFIRKTKRNQASAKVGINVGKQKKTAAVMNKGRRAPHSHLVALGTVQRFHKSGKSTGMMPANPFVKFASTGAESSVKNMMRERARRGIQKQTALAMGKAAGARTL